MVRTLADIAGGGSTVPLTTDRTASAKGWVKFTSTGGLCRIGDSPVAINRGDPVDDGGSVMWPAISPPWNAYVLADQYAYVPVGATLSITYLE